LVSTATFSWRLNFWNIRFYGILVTLSAIVILVMCGEFLVTKELNMRTVCKVRVNSKQDIDNSREPSCHPDGSGFVHMSAVYSDDPESENGKFFSMTPSANIQLGVLNPAAYANFEVGKEYYATFELASTE